MDHRISIVVIVVLVLLCLTLATVWWSFQLPKDRITPVCNSNEKDVCAASYSVLSRVDDILQDCGRRYKEKYGGKTSNYVLKEHPDKAYSFLKRSIHLKIRKKDGNFFDDTTLIYVGLHELAHTLCIKMDGNDHGPEFQRVFTNLIEIGIELGYIKEDSKIDPDY
jgi:hypothetical protein